MEDWFSEYIRRIKREIDKTFKEIESEFFSPLIDYNNKCLIPLYDVKETINEIIIHVDLPNVKSKKDIEVMISETEVIVEAKLVRSIKFEDLVIYGKQAYDKFRLEIPLNVPVETEKAKAIFRNGMLEIHIPKKIRFHKIEIE